MRYDTFATEYDKYKSTIGANQSLCKIYGHKELVKNTDNGRLVCSRCRTSLKYILHGLFEPLDDNS